MTSAQVVETSVNVISNSPSQDYTHPDDRTLLNKNIYLWNIQFVSRLYCIRYQVIILIFEERIIFIFKYLLFPLT